MLPKRFQASIGRPPGTYLSGLPKELREELFQYSAKCRYNVILDEQNFTGNGVVTLRINGSGIDIYVPLDVVYMARNNQRVDQFIDGIFQSLRLGSPESGDSVISSLELGHNESISIDGKMILIEPYGRFPTTSFEICTELVEALLRVHELVQIIKATIRIV